MIILWLLSIVSVLGLCWLDPSNKRCRTRCPICHRRVSDWTHHYDRRHGDLP